MGKSLISDVYKSKKNNDVKILLNISPFPGCTSLVQLLDIGIKTKFQGAVFEMFEQHVGDHLEQNYHLQMKNEKWRRQSTSFEFRIPAIKLKKKQIWLTAAS